MLLYPSIPQLLHHVSSRYRLVNVVAHRARAISEEAEEKGLELEEKPVSMAVREVAEGKLDYLA